MVVSQLSGEKHLFEHQGKIIFKVVFPLKIHICDSVMNY